jgi:hypothetical protein
MTRRDSRAELQKWFLDVDELLAAQRAHAISPSTVSSPARDQATWTMTLGALRRHLVGLVDLLVDSPGRWIFILDVGRPGGRYVQLLVHEDGSILYEVSSNNALDETDRLSTPQEQALAAMGWNAPRGESQPNWWAIEATISPDTKAVVTRLLKTFEGVFCLRGSDVLTARVLSTPVRGYTPAFLAATQPALTYHG